MKKHYQFSFVRFLSFIFAVSFSSFVTAQTGNFKLKTDKENSLKLTENNYQKLSFKNTISDFSFMKVKTEKGIFTELSSPDYGTSMVLGNPKLPMLKKLIEVPVGANPKVKIVSYNVTEYNLSDFGILNPIIPSQPSVSKDIHAKKPEFKYNESVYSNNAYLSNDLASIDIIGFMRGVRIGRLNIAPVQYNPVTNSIMVYNDLEVEITFDNADVAQTIALKEKNYSIYFNAVYDKLLNYKPLQVKANLTQYPVKYVIVAPPMFQAALQPFVQWKTKKGFTVVEAYTNNPLVGTTTTSIKAYLQGLYTAGTVSDPAPSFVLFVGDVAQIPAFPGTTDSHVTDLYYCEYTGDFLPECYYGRFSANDTSELNPQIRKTLEYEQYLMPDPSFLGNCVMISGQDESGGTYSLLNGDGQINYGTTYYFNPAHNMNSHTYLYATSGTSAAAIINNVSAGCAFANYTAHGSPDGWYDPAFSISDIAGLTNAHKYPLMVGNCCLTNKFDDALCFGEALLRANNKGAIGYIGGSNSSYWDEDYWWGVGYKTVAANPTYSAANLGSYDCTFHDQGEAFANWFVTQGQMISAGNLAVTQSGSSLTGYYWEIYHLMGDPSLMIYFSVPPAITATYNPQVNIGDTTFTVDTEPYAYIGISQNGILHGVALADIHGSAVIHCTAFTTAGIANVVVTKQNRAPKIDNIIVTAVNEISTSENGSLTCYPNPVADNALINYTVNHNGDVSIVLFNSFGQKVRTLVLDANKSKGVYSVTLDARGLSDGIYYCILNSDNNIITRKLVITKNKF